MASGFKTLGDNLSTWFENLKENFTNITNSIGGWFSDLGTSINNKFNEWKEERAREKAEEQARREEEKRQKEEEKRKEEEQKQDNESQIGDIAGDVNNVIGDKFKSFYTLKDFLSEFWNSIFESDGTPPEFNITLPAFCGGGTYNVLDLRFYNQYRNYIHGIIAGICYFVYIKKLYHNLPNIIR